MTGYINTLDQDGKVGLSKLADFTARVVRTAINISAQVIFNRLRQAVPTEGWGKEAGFAPRSLAFGMLLVLRHDVADVVLIV